MLNLPYKHIHLIGIGGIGVSALAKLLLNYGYHITGSTIETNEQVEILQSRGVKISVGHDQANVVGSVDAIIHSSAVNQANPEIVKGKSLNLPLFDYHDFLGLISKQYKTIAVAGTHGKSTTTALTAKILTASGIDPTVIVGSKVAGFDDNFRLGHGEYLVVEADEFNFGMLHLDPHIILLNNIEADHLDCYKDLDDIVQSFDKFVNKLPQDGCLIYNGDDKNILKIIDQKSDYNLINVNHQTGEYLYQFSQNNQIKINNFTFEHNLWGDYNDTNIAMAVNLALYLGVDEKIIQATLKEFLGIWRRFEVLTDNALNKNITIVSDYAHHPTALAGIIKASQKRYQGKKVWIIFQPHHYDRVSNFFDDFVNAMKLADNPVLIKTYDVPGREGDGVRAKTSADIADQVPNCVYLDEANEVKDFIKNNVGADEVVMAIGAGTIDGVVRKLIADK